MTRVRGALPWPRPSFLRFPSLSESEERGLLRLARTGVGELVSGRRLRRDFSFFFSLGLGTSRAFFSFLFFLSLGSFATLSRALFSFGDLTGAGAGAGVGAGAGAGVSRGGDASSRSLRALHARARRPLSRQLWPSAANCHWRQVRFQNSCWALEPAERFTRLQQ